MEVKLILIFHERKKSFGKLCVLRNSLFHEAKQNDPQLTQNKRENYNEFNEKLRI
jgi:hypothetical protein